jgi:hypothetical protein
MSDVMDVRLLRMLRKMFASEYADRKLQRRNIREWVRARRIVGSNYLLR